VFGTWATFSIKVYLRIGQTSEVFADIESELSRWLAGWQRRQRRPQTPSNTKSNALFTSRSTASTYIMADSNNPSSAVIPPPTRSNRPMSEALLNEKVRSEEGRHGNSSRRDRKSQDNSELI